VLPNCLHDHVRKYSGADFPEHFIIAAKNRQNILRIENAEFFCESTESFCSRNHEKSDAGFVLDLAGHVPEREWSTIRSALRRSIKPGGRLCFHTPNAGFFLAMMKKKNFIVHPFEEHGAVRDEHQNLRMLEDAGFTPSEVKMLPHYNLLRYMHFLSFFPFEGNYFKARIFIIAEK
jgi:2-polyprenyl-3-methyl-5-hydroxy-6-metoxy-1,4-benzoquinol methylase